MMDEGVLVEAHVQDNADMASYESWNSCKEVGGLEPERARARRESNPGSSSLGFLGKRGLCHANYVSGRIKIARAILEELTGNYVRS